MSMRSVMVFALLLVSVAACGPAAPTARPAPESGGQAASAAQKRTLVIIGRGEPPTIAAKPLQPYSGSLAAPIRLFNAQLDSVDEREVPRPYLAEAVPQLNTDTWRVFPDGRMETAYRLKPNLTWHDGTSLTADDFVFGWRVFSTPELGAATSSPVGDMAEVVARDARTLLIRWRHVYPDAAGLDLGFQALPRHLLEQPFQQLDAQAFSNLPFWTHDYVGAGPYRVEAWQPGASIDGVAFDGHALGRARIDRIRVLFMADSNTALASMLSGDAHYVSDFIFWYEEGATLEKEWAARGGTPGVMLYAPVLIRPTGIQMRPEFVNPRALLDVRVRRAIAHGMDAPSAVEITTGGRGVLTWSLTSPRADYYPAIESAIAKHPYDPRLTARYLEEAGLVRGDDGFYAMANGEPFRVEVATDGGATNERENTIFVDSLRRAGVDAFSRVIPVAQLRDTQARNTAPALNTGGVGARPLGQMVSSAVPRAENRWGGNNRGGWTNQEFDRAWQAFSATLDPSERIRHLAQMERILSEDVGMIPNLFTIVVNAHVAALRGPIQRTTPDAGSGILHVHTWEWAS